MIAHGLRVLGFTPGVDFNCRDDGEGPYIREWLSKEPQPSPEDIAAAAEIPTIPASVSPWQAREVLRLAGILAQVNAHIDGLGDDHAAYIAWHYAEIIRRNSPFVETLAPRFNLSDQQIDALFIQAAGLSL